MTEILVPIAICVILPVLVVWLVMRARQNETNKKTEIMLKSIESGATIDTDFFKATAKQQKPKSIKEKLLGRLTGALVTGLLGVAFLIVGFVLCNKPGMDEDALLLLFLFGGILLAIGAALLAVYFVGKRMLAKEMAAEEKALEC